SDRQDSHRQDSHRQDGEPAMTTATRDAATPQAATASSGRPGPIGLPRLLSAAGQPMDLAAHLQVHGRTPYRGGPGMLIHTIESAGLTGRGGAAFPVHHKLTAVANQKGAPVVVGNGAEGEAASDKDKTLLWSCPHLVLAGEESALANRVEGCAALPRFTPPRIFERGVGGAPTLVQNVETLAQVALVSRYGAAWFRSVGTEAEPGSMLTTARLAGGDGGVAEAPIGIPIAELLR